jgi:hypothetical protein
MKLIYFMLLIIFLFTSCSNENKKLKTKDLITFQTLNIPLKLTVFNPFKKVLKDSLEISNAPFKIYTSINISCPSCIDKVNLWNNFIKLDVNKGVPLVIIFNSEDKFRLMQYLINNNEIKPFQYPFFLDSLNTFSKNKPFSKSNEINAVLTNNKNEILLVGDFLKNESDRKKLIVILENLK